MKSSTSRVQIVNLTDGCDMKTAATAVWGRALLPGRSRYNVEWQPRWCRRRETAVSNTTVKEVVIKLQREVATVVLSNVETLNFSSLGWSVGDAKCLAKALPHCWRLKSLNVTDNALGRAGAEVLAEAIAANGVLIALDLTQNAIGSDGAAAIAKALAANRVLTSLSLACNKIGVDGASAIAAAVEANGTLTTLNLDVNKIGPKGAAALVKALEAGGGVLTTLPASVTRVRPRSPKLSGC